MAEAGDTLETKFPLLAVLEEEMSTVSMRRQLHAEVCRFLSWSLDHAARGVHPEVGFYGDAFSGFRATMQGTPLMHDCFRAVLAGIKSDTKMKVQMHAFSRFWACTMLCERCMAMQPFRRAGGSELSFGDLRMTATWRRTMISHQTYLLTEPQISPWNQVAGFHLEVIWRDIMHTLYQGVGQDLAASLIFSMLEEGQLSPGPRDTSLKLLYRELQQWCKQVPIACPTVVFSLKTIGKAPGSMHDFPCLVNAFKASHVKVTPCATGRGKSLLIVGLAEHRCPLASMARV